MQHDRILYACIKLIRKSRTRILIRKSSDWTIFMGYLHTTNIHINVEPLPLFASTFIIVIRFHQNKQKLQFSSSLIFNQLLLFIQFFYEYCITSTRSLITITYFTDTYLSCKLSTYFK